MDGFDIAAFKLLSAKYTNFSKDIFCEKKFKAVISRGIAFHGLVWGTFFIAFGIMSRQLTTYPFGEKSAATKHNGVCWFILCLQHFRGSI